jgi:UDPglucose--hexose-1-phosphate uridylyltransferase
VSPVLWDPFSGEPILLAPRRAERPHDTGAPSTAGNSCPFCEGAESQTPPEVLAVRPGGGPPDGPGWLVRAFANKFPAVAPDEGVHEVIVTTPRHIVSFADATDEEVSRAVWAWSERLAAVALDERRLWPFLFLNQGAPAGASLQHSHVQMVGLPFSPPRLVRRENVFAMARICPVCADLATASPRMVADGGEIVAWCPAVPPLSGTIWLAPRRHVAGWADELDSGAVGRALRDLVARLRSALGAEAVNSWLHQRRPGTNGHYHWHIEVVARLGTLAGLELGTGAIALAQEPEALASRLRSAG